MQTTFNAIKKMGSGLSSPRTEVLMKAENGGGERGTPGSAGSNSREKDGWGYFDVVPEGVEA